jgi:hypothetical protein
VSSVKAGQPKTPSPCASHAATQTITYGPEGPSRPDQRPGPAHTYAGRPEKIARLLRTLTMTGVPEGDDPEPQDIGYYAPLR